MILTKLNEDTLLITSSTKESTDTNYTFIATNTVTNKTIELPVVISSSTPRVDTLPVATSGSVQEVGYWNYLLVKTEFTGSYDTITDIQLNNTDLVVERGKMLITNEEGKIPREVYEGQSSQRKTYNG